MPSLSVSVVNYYSDRPRLAETLQSLKRAMEVAKASGDLTTATVSLIDNEPGSASAKALDVLGVDLGAEVIGGQGNIGFGRAHNLALKRSGAEFHLFLNPDTVLTQTALVQALQFMIRYPDVVILCPAMVGDDGQPQFPCKRYPSVLDLALRGFAPPSLRRHFAARLARYEMRDLPQDRPSFGIPLLSGSFMFCRREPIAVLGGFSDAFFVYFEDFDLSMRAHAIGTLAYSPDISIEHSGGKAAKKGLRHILLFVQGAVRFFQRHGWRWF